MAFDKDAFLTALDSMSVMDLNDLVKAIEARKATTISLTTRRKKKSSADSNQREFALAA
jgi:ribosomal protein L7/L12